MSTVRVSTAHWPLLAAVAGVTLAGLPTVNFQYGPDQALFAYIGRKLVQGDVLYVDWWDVKPPGVFWTYALVAWLPGGARTVRAFDLLVTLATVAAVYALGRLYWGRGAGAVAGFLYGLVYVTGSGYWNMAQPDSFMVLPLVLGVLAWERGRQTGSRGALLVAGVLFGVAYQYRPVVVLFPLVLVAWQALEGGWRRAVESALLLTAGALAVQGAVMLYLLLGGALGEYLYAQFRFARHYAALGGPYAFDRLTLGNYLSGLRGGVMWFVNSRLLLTAPAFVALFLGGSLGGDRALYRCGLLLLAAVVGVAVQAKFFVYHWHIALPFLALPAGWALVQAWRALRARYASLPAAGGLAVVTAALLLLTPLVTDRGLGEWRDLVRYVREPAYRSIYYDRFGLRGHGTYSFKASEEVAGYVRVRTKPGDTVFVWGYDPNFYLLSGRDSASRFLSLLPLMPTFTPAAWRHEFVQELERKRPAYILLQRGENARWITGRPDDSYEWVPQFTEFYDLLQREYRFDRRIEDYFIYVRNH